MQAHTFSNGVCVVNLTKHSIRFQELDGSLVEIDPAGPVLDARVENTGVTIDNVVGDAEFVTPKFFGTDEGDKLLRQVQRENPGSIAITSVIGAQAYPLQPDRAPAAAMVAAPGFERVPPAEKRMNPARFTVYSK